MKTIKILAFSLLMLSGAGLSAQTKTVKDAAGNYHAVKSSGVSVSTAKATGKKFTDSKGKVYPVMVSKNGKLFYIRTSKAGNKYNAYIN